jgi:hypothetical protein
LDWRGTTAKIGYGLATIPVAGFMAAMALRDALQDKDKRLEHKAVARLRQLGFDIGEEESGSAVLKAVITRLLAMAMR